jgi:hypothetical protein
MTLMDMSWHSRGAISPELCISFRPQRAQGMPGAQRTRSLACKNKKAHKHSHHGHIGITRHSPRNGLRLIPRSPR